MMPIEVGREEEFARGIFKDKAGKKIVIKASHFYPNPANSEEVSVTRLSFSQLEFCKKQFRNMAQPEEGRFFGLIARLTSNFIFSIGLSCDISPNAINPYHTNILLGLCKVGKGTPYPPEMRDLIDKVAQKAEPCYEE